MNGLNQIKWRVLSGKTDSRSPCTDIHRALLMSVSEGKSPPTILVHRWPNETMSFPRRKSIQPLVETNIARVERTSGGKPLYHHPSDPTYCIVAPFRLFLEFAGASKVETAPLYRICLEWQVDALNRMGIRANLTKEKGEESDACMLDRSTPHNDVYVNGKKISGNAMDSRKGVFMLHGSIFYDSDINRIASVYSSFGMQKQPQDIADSITWIRRELPLDKQSSISSDEATDRLRESLIKDKDYFEGELTEYEMDLIKEKNALVSK